MTLLSRLALPVLSLLAGCAPGLAPQTPSLALLDRLPARIGPFAAVGPASPAPGTAPDIAGRRFAMQGALASVTLGGKADGKPVPDGAESAESRVLLECLTNLTMTAARPEAQAAGFGPWRREADQTFRTPDGPALRCSVLRRPRGEGAQVRYHCITGVLGRFLGVGVSVNHDAMTALAAQSLAGRFASEVGRMIATGKGLAPPVAAAPAPQAKLPPAAEDDAVPDL